MLNFITHWLPLLDAIAKIATTAGVVGLLLAYFQYKHAVRIAKRADRRASVELAVKECTNFGGILMPELMKVSKGIDGSGCEFFKHFKLIRDRDTLKPDTSAVTDTDYAKLNEHQHETLRLLNLIEGFAIPFVAGVADNEVGFVECGHTFVQTFELLFGLYSRHDLKRIYPSTQALYWRWRKQLEVDERRRMTLDAGRQFFALTEEIVRTESNSKTLVFASSFLKWISEQLSHKK